MSKNDKNPNGEDVNNVSDAREALDKTLGNLSVEADSETVGAGYRVKHMNRADDAAIQKAKKEKNKSKSHNALLKQIQADIAALLERRAELENELGGLDGIGKKIGLERNPNESEEDYRTRLKEEIFAQIASGTLNDPTGNLTEWANTQDEYEQKAALKAEKVNALEELVQINEDIAQIDEQLEQAMSEIDDSISRAARLSENDVVSKAAEIENSSRFDCGEASVTNVTLGVTEQENSSDDFMSRKSFASAHDLAIRENFTVASAVDDLMGDGMGLMADDVSLMSTTIEK